MEKPNDCLQKDAVPTEGFEMVRSQSESSEVSRPMLLAQNNTATSYTFNECHGVQLGTVIRIGNTAEGGLRNSAVVRKTGGPDEAAYAKTPTIKVGSLNIPGGSDYDIKFEIPQAMMEDRQPMSPALLDFLSSSFGKRWREVTIRLRIDQIFVDR